MGNQYNARLAKVEEALQAVLGAIDSEEGSELLVGNDQRLDSSLWRAVLEPSATLVNRGGKRWRPVLMTLAGEMAGDGDAACGLSPLVELIHNGTLVVDDIEDGASERRGEPAVHMLFGADRSINSANLLYCLYGPLIDRGPWNSKTSLFLYRLTLESLRKLHWGQGLDIEWHNRPEYIPSALEYETMSRYKTGALARLAAQGGFVAGGGDEETAEVLGTAAETMGLGFQIMDDVINLRSGNPGKARGDDLSEGKKSYPVLMHRELKPDPHWLDRLNSLRGLSPRSHEPEFTDLISEMEASGAVERARNRGLEALDSARTLLLTNAPDSIPRDIWLSMIDGFAQTGDVKTSG